MSDFRTSFLNDHQLPLVIQPTDPSKSMNELMDLVRSQDPFFKQKLLEHGGLLFRDFPIHNVDGFIDIMKALDLGHFIEYIGGGAPRNKIKENVYTSTEAPPAIKIHLHNEMSFADNYPKHICFYCETPSPTGGETFIGDARKIFKDAPEDLKQKFQTRGLKYVSRYYYKSKLMDLVNKFQRGHKTWSDVFATTKKEEVEKKCAAANIQCKWNQHDWLEISRMRPAFLEHPITKENVWFNQVHLFDYNPRFIGWWRYIAMKILYCRQHMRVDEVYFKDGQKLPRKDIYQVMDLLDKHAVYFPWQKGDVLVLDNLLTMHGRAPFEGKRRVMTAMTQ